MPPRRDPDVVSHWAHRLFGISERRQADAQRTIAHWGIRHISRALSQDDLDGAIAAVLLTEGVDELARRGADANRLVGKLRRDPDVWPTWAEIRAAALFARHAPEGARLVLEPRGPCGRRSDFALLNGQHRMNIEFKALGLSDEESAFEASMGLLLERLLPRRGLLTMHVGHPAPTINLSRAERRMRKREAEKRAKYLLPPLSSIATATIVGHGTEPGYARRLSDRFLEACRQLDPDDESWVGFHWSNGASVESVRAALASIPVPSFIAGVAVVGSVGLPGRLDNYVVMMPTPFGADGGEDRWGSDTELGPTKAAFGYVNASAGVRPTYIATIGGPGRIRLLHRRGQRRIHPYNVVLDPDPSRYGRPLAPQDRARYFPEG